MEGDTYLYLPRRSDVWIGEYVENVWYSAAMMDGAARAQGDATRGGAVPAARTHSCARVAHHSRIKTKVNVAPIYLDAHLHRSNAPAPAPKPAPARSKSRPLSHVSMFAYTAFLRFM